MSGRGTPNIVMGGGSLKISHPGVHRAGAAHSSVSSTIVPIPYEQVAKAVDNMIKLINNRRELVLKDRGFALIPDALRFQCQTFEQLLAV